MFSIDDLGVAVRKYQERVCFGLQSEGTVHSGKEGLVWGAGRQLLVVRHPQSGNKEMNPCSAHFFLLLSSGTHEYALPTVGAGLPTSVNIT